MTKSLPAGLQAHLDSGATTMALCWRLERQDGVVMGFTEHDRDLTFGGDTYSAETSFTSSRISQSLGLSVDNLDVDGALSATTLLEEDLAAGLYDNAEVHLWWVNWQDVFERVLLARGNLGEVRRGETVFRAELRSMAHRLNQKVGRKYQRTCDAVVGDARCGVDLTQVAYRSTGTVTSASGRRVVTSGAATYAEGWFTGGVLTLTTGDNAGLSFEVKVHSGAQVTLWDEPKYPVGVGDAYTLTAGCAQDTGTCHSKFNNIANFRGFPHIPGQSSLQRVALQGEDDFDGGSLFR